MAGDNALHTDSGGTDAQNARLAQAGLLAVQGPSILDARTGVLAGPGSQTIVTGTTDTGQMTVAVAPHQWVTSRGAANGPYLGKLAASTKVNIDPAPGSGTRTDVVWVKQKDATAGVPNPDDVSAPQYGVTTGTVGSGKPPIPVGCEELGTVAVSAGATSTGGAGVTITNTARQTVARGARIPVRDQVARDALSGYPGLEVYRLDTGTVEMYGLTGQWLTVFDPNWTSYTPTWTTKGTGTALPTLNDGTLIGRHRKSGLFCEVDIFLKFGANTYGGYDQYRFALPFPAATGRDQSLLVKSYSQAGDHVGYGLITTGASIVVPYLPVSNSASNLAPAQNANASNTAATGIPFVSGTYPFHPGHVIEISGRYETAS